MYLVSKDRNRLINLDNVTCIFASADGKSIKAQFSNGTGCQVDEYDGSVADEVIDMMCRTMSAGKVPVFFMPDDERVRAATANNEQRWRHATGKKTKGHGGS